MFISIKTTSPHKNNLRAEKFFCMAHWDFYGVCSTTVKKLAPCDIYFFQKSWTKLCSWMKWAFLENNCFRYWNFMPLNRMFGDINIYKIFSVLNLTITCLNSFTSNKTTFSVSFFKCWMKHHLTITSSFKNTSLTVFNIFIEHWPTDSASIH